MAFNGISLKEEGAQTSIEFKDEQQRLIIHSSPDDALCKINSDIIDRESVRQFLVNLIKPQLPNNVTELNLVLRQEDDYAFFYRYSHGLKKHDGNCQRIAHGHRSRIQIWENNKRSRTWEQYWADKFEDIYIGTREDIVSSDSNRTCFEYQAPQGKFMLELENECIHLIEYDSTVECIAQHIAEEIHKQHPKSSIKVKAFEGVKKGAVAEI